MTEIYCSVGDFLKTHPPLAQRRHSPHAQPRFSDAEVLTIALVLLITRAQAPSHRFVLSQVRQQIETTFSQLWWKFIDRVFSRSWSGWCNTLQLKVLSYNLRHAGILPA